MTTRPCLPLFVVIPLVLIACPIDEPPEPLTPAEVFAACDIESLCAAFNEVEPDPAIAACIYQALRDRTPGRVRWELVYPDAGVIDRLDVFLGADGRVIRWGHDGGIERVEDVELRPPEFFDGCLADVNQGLPVGCSPVEWIEGEAVEVEAVCVTSP